MVSWGISERLALKIAGRRSRVVFDRYPVVSPTGVQDTTRKLPDNPSDRRHTHRHNGGILTVIACATVVPRIATHT
jgi:hypothetical protein